jgi:hypothetical protein
MKEPFGRLPASAGELTIAAWAFAMALACWLAPAGAHAGPPYVTDDPEPVELRHLEVYVATQGGYGRDRSLAFTAPHLEVNYGAAPDLQLHLIAPLQYVHPAGASVAYGYGDTELGAKYRLVHETDVIPQVGTFPLLEVPTGDEARGLGAGRIQALLPVWLQKSFGRWLTYGGAGYWINPGPGNHDWLFVGFHAEAKLGPVAPGVEIFHETSKRAGEPGDTRFALGAVVDLTEEHHVLVSAGRVIAAGVPAFQWYLAYQLTTGPDEPGAEKR